LNQNKNEGFQSTSSGYQADIEAIRNLSSIATQLTTNNNLTVPGDLKVTNNLIVKSGNEARQILLGEGEIKFRGDGKAHYSITNKDGYFKISNTSNNSILNNGLVNDSLVIDTLGSLTSNRINNKENNARYIRIGNKIDSKLRQNYWTIIEVRVYSHSGENIALKKPVTLIEGQKWKGVTGDNGIPSNITNDIIFTYYAPSVDYMYHSLGDNYQLGFIGDVGIHVLQIDLGAEYNISQIEVFNRFNQDYCWRADGTTIELIDSNNIVNKIIYTGLWHTQYSRTFLL